MTSKNGEEESNNGSSIIAEVLSASIGGMLSASALYPLEVIKTKLQAANSSPTNGSTSHTDEEEGDDKETPDTTTTSAWGLAKYMYRTQGLSSFYNGIGTSAIQSGTEKALYFFAYTWLKNIYYSTCKGSSSSNSHDTIMSPTTNLLLGCAAEWAHLPITLPMDCLTTRIQTSTSKSASTSSYALLCTMLSEGGMYKGIQAYVVLCLKPAIQYTVYEQVKHYYLTRIRNSNRKENDNNKNESLTSAQAFLLGIISRTISTIVVFPYIRAKVLLQQQQASTTTATTSIPTLIANLVKNHGLSSIFQGLGPELTRGVLSTAFMMMAKEKISTVVTAAFLSSVRRRTMLSNNNASTKD